MKRLLVLSILLALGSSFVGAASMAQDDSKRTVNPGEDPNEARSGNATEGSVSATGICNDCIARMTGASTGRGSRLNDDTTFRPKGSDGSTGGSEKSATGTR